MQFVTNFDHLFNVRIDDLIYKQKKLRKNSCIVTNRIIRGHLDKMLFPNDKDIKEHTKVKLQLTVYKRYQLRIPCNIKLSFSKTKTMGFSGILQTTTAVVAQWQMCIRDRYTTRIVYHVACYNLLLSELQFTHF